MFDFARLFRRNPHLEPARALYARAVRAARHPEFYTVLGVPDTPEGRFEMLALHAFLILKRLKAAADAKALAQTVFDEMFKDVDENLRELGVGDMSVGKKVKSLAKSFYGRIAAYESALAAGGADLADALARFPYRQTTPAPAALAALANYVRAQDAHLAGQGDAALLAGDVAFRAPDAGLRTSGEATVP